MKNYVGIAIDNDAGKMSNNGFSECETPKFVD